MLTVPIVRTINTFVVRAFTATGSALNCEPAEFCIQKIVVSVEAPPLPSSFWLEVEDERRENKVRGEMVLAKGTPLPATATKRVRTTKELVRGGSNVVNLNLYEGESKVLRANVRIRCLPLTGDSIPRKLPAGTEIEVRVKVDASRRVIAEAYIPAADESYELPKCDERHDVTNPHQLEYRRLALAKQVEALEDGSSNPDVKVKLELCRRQLWSEDVMKTIRAAKSGERDSADAHQRVDEALRTVEERLVLLQEEEQKHILPNEWRKVCRRANHLLATEWATEQDREHCDAVQKQGDSALARGDRWHSLEECIREMGQLVFNIEQRDPEFWRAIADDLADEPDCYTNPEEARIALARLARPRSRDELKSDVVRLVKLLPNRGGDGSGGVLPFVRLIG